MYIRQAKTSDAAAIAPLFNQYREFYKQASDLKGAEAFLKARLENDESIILIAEENGEFIGFTQLYPTFSSVAMKRIYILNDLFVTPHARTMAPRAAAVCRKEFCCGKRGKPFIASDGAPQPDGKELI